MRSCTNVKYHEPPTSNHTMNLVGLPQLSAEPLPNEGQRVRSLIRQATITSTSRGQTMGFLQCHLAILPKTHADDFWLYCQRNAKACPGSGSDATWSHRAAALGTRCKLGHARP
jgi:uncharacterized protein YcsI (UPF0317 family)